IFIPDTSIGGTATIISKRGTVISAPDAVISGPPIIIDRRDAIMAMGRRVVVIVLGGRKLMLPGSSPMLQGNPIHRPATATVPERASETPATSLFQGGLMRVWSAMTTLRRTANVKRRARTNAAIFIQKAFM